MTERNVLGGALQPCSNDPVTGFYRDGTCVCAVMTAEFLEHQRTVGNDLVTAHPQWNFPGLVPGDRWCVVTVRWQQAYADGVAAPVVLGATSERALELVPLEWLVEHSVDVPDDPGALSRES
jgi:uncharacterized protein (DUF2237 family)